MQLSYFACCEAENIINFQSCPNQVTGGFDARSRSDGVLREGRSKLCTSASLQISDEISNAMILKMTVINEGATKE
jgi:hypothetical protein